MTKKEMIGKLIEPIVWNSLTQAYGINVSSPSDKQLVLAQLIVDGVVDLVGSKYTVKELKETLGDTDDQMHFDDLLKEKI